MDLNINLIYNKDYIEYGRKKNATSINNSIDINANVYRSRSCSKKELNL